MALTDREAERLNQSMPVANDIKLGSVIKGLQINTGGEINIKWADIKDKPDTFIPASHRHGIAEITNLQKELDDIKARLAALEEGSA